ncbi:MAG: uL13 family ribosomal protein, partial [Methanocorpusculum sp.]|nr:uL13 family ribosomal protein [Methanocorpusculum sp.]
MVTVIDGENLLLGRLSSIVATRILAGEEIAIINAEKVIVSG